jgi:hypothetical protein
MAESRRYVSSCANASDVASMTDDDERFDYWLPAPGQIVRVKPGFRGSIQERAFNRVAEEGGPKLKLDENKLYEVVECEADKDQRALHLQEINVIYVAGEHFLTKGDRVPYPLSIELFQVAPEYNIARRPSP